MYDAVPHAVWIVAKSVQSLELSQKPTPRLSKTGRTMTIEILVTDQSNTNSSEYTPC